MYAILIKACKETNSSIAQVGYKKVSDENIDINKEIGKYDCKIYDSVSTFKEDYINDNEIFTDLVWNKIYKKEIFDNIKFKKGVYFEDSFIKPRLLLACEKFVDINIDLYYYFVIGNDNSKIVKLPPSSRINIPEVQIELPCEQSLVAIEKKISFVNELINRNLFNSLFRFCRMLGDNYYKDIIDKERKIILDTYLENDKYITNKITKFLFELFRQKNYSLLKFYCIILRNFNFGKKRIK